MCGLTFFIHTIIEQVQFLMGFLLIKERRNMLGCVNEINSGGTPSLDDLVVEFVAKLLCMLNKNMNTAQLHIKLYCFRNGYVTSILHKTVF